MCTEWQACGRSAPTSASFLHLRRADEQSSGETPEAEDMQEGSAGEEQQQQPAAMEQEQPQHAGHEEPLQQPAGTPLADGPLADGTPVVPPSRRGQQQQRRGPGREASTPRPQRGGAAGEEEAPVGEGGEQQQAQPFEDIAGTPYDNVLAMLRQGPLSVNSPRFTFRPRSAQPGSGSRSPVPAPPQFAPSPSPPLFSAGRTPGAELAQQRRLGASRFAPQGGAAATPGGAAARPGGAFGPRAVGASRVQFARTPLAAGVARPSTTGTGAAAAPAAAGPRFSALPPPAADASAADAAAASPAPLAWTPMRSNVVGLRAAGGAAGAVGSKRKADSESPEQEGGPWRCRRVYAHWTQFMCSFWLRSADCVGLLCPITGRDQLVALERPAGPPCPAHTRRPPCFCPPVRRGPHQSAGCTAPHPAARRALPGPGQRRAAQLARGAHALPCGRCVALCAPAGGGGAASRRGRLAAHPARCGAAAACS